MTKRIDSIGSKLYEVLVDSEPEDVQDLARMITEYKKSFPYFAARMTPIVKTLFDAIEEAGNDADRLN